jgi:hypothetical protein
VESLAPAAPTNHSYIISGGLLTISFADFTTQNTSRVATNYGDDLTCRDSQKKPLITFCVSIVIVTWLSVTIVNIAAAQKQVLRSLKQNVEFVVGYSVTILSSPRHLGLVEIKGLKDLQITILIPNLDGSRASIGGRSVELRL